MAGVVITGASTGIGRACAVRLARGGFRVFAGVRKEADGEDLQREVGGNLEPLLLDVTDAGQIGEARDKVRERLGSEPLAGLVNNAGIAIGGPVEYLPLDEWRQQFEVNLFGVVAVTQAFMDDLRRASGRIVIIGSNSGRVANPLMAPYAASKHAVEALGEALRHELRQWGIRTVVVEPGAVRTPVWEKGRADADRLEAELPAEARQRYEGFIRLIRRGIDRQEEAGIDPDEVAKVVERALRARSPRARYPVGVDAKLAAGLTRALPDRARDGLMRLVMDRI